MLLSAGRAEGSLVPSIKYVLVPNHRPPSREGHLFTDNTEALSAVVSARLAEQLCPHCNETFPIAWDERPRTKP